MFEVEDASTGTEIFYFVPLIIKYTNNVNTYCITFSPAPPSKPPAGPSSIPVIVNGKPITKICHFAINGYYDIGILFQYNNPPPNSNSAFACVYSMIIISPASGVYYFYFWNISVTYNHSYQVLTTKSPYYYDLQEYGTSEGLSEIVSSLPS
ncbi:hypothetical protein CM19_04435 [Candidatus Acidianus copahuensis]|uniref:Uncharacterized protein n=1 Tax=Candidatus Acidianus copahuensis TaxID=1160895 RepID=A0A031LP56_9CREN|nr:hypothetical protein [Candidatus Acidianus copahuensis]EZQ10147.1 hypothetical protein CM19_04435 [Candidatus Acidianus copahuensis]